MDLSRARVTPSLTRPGETYVFTYNKRGRVSSLTRNAVAYATYGYNALQQMTSRSTAAPGGPTGTVHYIYDLDGHLIAEADAATGTTSREYVWVPSSAWGPVDTPVAMVEGGATYAVETDHLGRPIKMIDTAKNIVWQATYKPYGEVQSLSGTKALNLRFPGQYFLIETGFAYNWHRHYDPITGRYTQPDPLRFVDGPSVYAYGIDSPLSRIDRNGLHETSGAGNTSGLPPVGIVSPNTEALQKMGISHSTAPNCGNCSEDQHRKLQNEVDYACSKPRACNGNMSKSEMSIMAQRNLECAWARDNINKTCFGGGDEGHKQAHDEAMNAYNNCVRMENGR